MTSPKGSFDLHLRYNMVDDVATILTTNVKGLDMYSAYTSRAKYLSFSIARKTNDEGTYFVVSCYVGGVMFEQYAYGPIEPLLSSDVRIYLFDEFISFYVNDLWIFSTGYKSVEYEDTVTGILSVVGGSISYESIITSELSDHREAVFVDYETSAENGISSVIQQRPIEIFSDTGPTLSFTYALIRDVVIAHNIEKLKETLEDPSQMASDALVYYADVAISIDRKVARGVGLITRMQRMSELETGAVKGAKMIQDRARQRRRMTTINGRLDARVEVGDVLVVNLIMSSTGRVVNKNVIVESVSISADEKRFSMRISARLKDE